MNATDNLTRSWAERLRTWRETVMHWSRREFVDEVIAVSYRTNEPRGHDLSESLVKKWEGGKVQEPQAVYQRILAVMNAPLPVPSRGSGPSLPSQASPDPAQDEDVDRRDFLQHTTSAAALTMGSAQLGDALQRLERALNGGTRIDDATVDDLERETQALFDAEERQSSSQVISKAVGHLDNLATLIGTAPSEQLASRLTAQAGTAAALAGWLAFDQGAFADAERHYATAEQAANQADDALLHACLRTYRSYLADARGRLKDSARYLQQAQAALPRGQQRTMHMWVAARQAEVAVSLGDTDTALRSLERAYLVQDFGHADDHSPPWTKFFTPTRLDGMAVAGYARVNHGDMHVVADRLLRNIGGGETKVEQIALADLAYSYLEHGDVERGADFAQRALAAISRSETRVGYDRLGLVARALTPYRDSRTTADLRQELDALHNTPS